MPIPQFRAGGSGFHIMFSNGITVSVQFGPGNYCQNHDKPFSEKPLAARCADAEIALYDRNGEWRTKEAHLAVTGEDAGDDVLGQVSPDDVVKYMTWAAAQKE